MPMLAKRLHRVIGLLHAVEERRVLLALALGDGADDADFAGEIPVERARAHPGFGADLLHRGAVEAAAGEAGDGRVDDALPRRHGLDGG